MSKQRPVGAYESTQCPASSLCGEIKKKLWLQSATNSAPNILSSWPQGVHKPVCHEVCLYIDTVHGMIWYQWKQKKRTIKQTSLCNSLWKIYKSKNNLDFWKCTGCVWKKRVSSKSAPYRRLMCPRVISSQKVVKMRHIGTFLCWELCTGGSWAGFRPIFGAKNLIFL